MTKTVRNALILNPTRASSSSDKEELKQRQVGGSGAGCPDMFGGERLIGAELCYERLNRDRKSGSTVADHLREALLKFTGVCALQQMWSPR